jgi:hypothetical protein
MFTTFQEILIMKVLHFNLYVLKHHHFLLQIHANPIKRKETNALDVVRKQLWVLHQYFMMLDEQKVNR